MEHGDEMVPFWDWYWFASAENQDISLGNAMNESLTMNSSAYILLDVFLCSIAEYFYELCCILTSPMGSSKYKQRVKILSDTTQQNV